MEEDNQIELAYPTEDNMLEIRIPEESKGIQDKVMVETSIQLETYEATHTLDTDYSFKNVSLVAEIVARVHHFKRALREFSFLEPTDIISIETSETYPKLQFVYRKGTQSRFHAVKFNDEIDEFLVKKIQESKAFFTVESLRLAFTRISSEQLICIFTLNVHGSLSVKLMHDTQTFLAESLILN